MKPAELKEFLNVCRKARVVPHIWGRQGIGKSQIVKQYADASNLQCIDLRLSLLEPGDLMGMPVIEDEKTVFKKPAWFPKPKTSGVLFLDELNRANEDILQAVFQLILDRRVNDHVLPEGWQVVCAGNYGKDFQVNELDAALMNRFCHVHLETDYKSWSDWANGKINDKLSKIVVENKLLEDKDSPFSIIDLPIKTTPRSWDFLNQLIMSGLPEKLFKEASYGLLSPKDAELFSKAFFMKDYIHLTVEDVLNANAKKLDKVVKHENVMQLCWSVNEELFIMLQKRQLAQLQLSNFIQYLAMLPDDIAYALMHKIIKDKTNDMRGAKTFDYVCQGDTKNIIDKIYKRLETFSPNEIK